MGAEGGGSEAAAKVKVTEKPAAALLSAEEYFQSRKEALSQWVRVPSLSFTRQLQEILQQGGIMSRSPRPSDSDSEQVAKDHQLVMECLHHYNLNHPDNEYVPAPGEVTAFGDARNGSWWTHGNFVASPKPFGCFSSLLSAPGTLFFFELVTKDGFESIVSCTPLEDEPVTEGYNLLGLSLGCGTRGDGSSDCRCKTCNYLVRSPVPYVGKAFPCGHYKAECVCEMCYIHSKVLHPSAQKFEFPSLKNEESTQSIIMDTKDL